MWGLGHQPWTVKSLYNFQLPQNLTANWLLLTESLTNNIKQLIYTFLKGFIHLFWRESQMTYT